MAHKHKLLIPAAILAASFAAGAALAGEPSRSPAITGPAIMADAPNPAALFKSQASQVIGNNSINDQLTVKNTSNPAVNRESPSPKRMPAVAPSSGPPGATTMSVE